MMAQHQNTSKAFIPTICRPYTHSTPTEYSGNPRTKRTRLSITEGDEFDFYWLNQYIWMCFSVHCSFSNKSNFFPG